ncbi:hypothetical protein AB0C14_06050 [Microbispora hainanensis]|uniref:hypothetical protein n=1 Tax=Microbispora hainanensis TaxID=568844 RepID=UPI0033D8977C
MSVDVGRNQLRVSFSVQRDAALSMPDGSPAALLTFYGAECGMKAAILDRLGLRSTAQLPEHLRNHDLHRLAKELRLPPSLCKRMQPCASQNAHEQVAFAELHQAWRYGRSLRRDHEKEALAVLRELLDWCRQELRT